MDTFTLIYTAGEPKYEFVFPAESTPAQVYFALKQIVACIEPHLPSRDALKDCLTEKPEESNDCID